MTLSVEKIVVRAATAAERGLEYVSVHTSERSFTLYRRAGFTDTNGVLELDLVER